MNKSAERIAAIAVLVLSVSAGFAAGDYPTLEYYVTDQVGVLTYSDIVSIEDFCVQVYESTGAEIAVLIVNTTLPDGIDLFAVRTFELNGLGQQGVDDGLLILVSVAESAWRIEVGYGLEGVLPDAKVGNIATTYLEPYVSVGDYYSGLFYTTETVAQEILDNYEGTPHESRSPYPISWIPLTTWQLIAVMVVVGAVAVLTKGQVFLWALFFLGRFGGGKRWGGGRSGGGGAKGRW